MATPYADLLVRFRADKKDFDSKARDVDQQMQVLGRGAKIAGAAVAAIVTSQALQQFAELAKRGGQINTVLRSTQQITGDATGAIRQLSSATRGLVSDYDLAVQLNRALTLGSAETVDEFEELARIAQGLGRALGVDTAYALESLNVGIARQSKLWLDNLGIIIDVDAANERYAESVGRSVKALTDAERAEAFRNEALRQGAEAIEELGAASENNGDKVAALGIAFGNLTDRAAEFIAQDRALGDVLETLTKIFNFFGQAPEPTLRPDVKELQDRTAAAGDYLDALIAQNEAEKAIAETVAIITTQLELSVESAQRMADALEAAKEAVEAAEFDDFVNSTEESRKNLEEARAEMERLVSAAGRLGGIDAIQILTGEPTARVPQFLGGPGGFELPGVSMPGPVSSIFGPGQSFLDRIIGGIDIGRTLETALGGLLTGGLNTLLGAGVGLLTSGIGRALGLGGPTATRDQEELLRAQRELAGKIERNSQAVERNTAQILGGPVANIPGALVAEALKALEVLGQEVPLDEDGRPVPLTQEQIAALETLRNIAEDLELEWDGSVEGLAQFKAALLATVYSLETFASGFDFLQRQISLLDIEDPVERFNRGIEFISGLVSDELAATLLGFIDNAEGFDDFINQVLGAIQDPEAFAELVASLDGVTLTEFLNWLSFSESALDELSSAASQAAEALLNVPTGFKYALSVFQASDPVQRSASSTSDLVMGMGATGGGMTVNISVNGAGNPSEVAQAVAKEFRREYERGGYGNQRLAGIGR